MLKLSTTISFAFSIFVLFLSGLLYLPSIFNFLCYHPIYNIFTPQEITLYRYILLAAGCITLLGNIAWMVSREKNWRKRIENDFCVYLQSDDMNHHTGSSFVWYGTATLLFLILALVQTMRWSVAYKGQSVWWFNLLTVESGVWETLTAVTLFMAGIILWLSMIKFRSSFPNKCAIWPVLAISMALILGAGEEISWGQHWFGFQTPPSINAINIQKEFNLHNMLNHHTINHSMILFFLLYCVVLPLLVYLFREIKYITQRVNVPVSPLPFVPFSLAGVLMSDMFLFRSLWGNPKWAISEARETVFGFIMLGVLKFVFFMSKKV